ncbi:MAG: hypothetical protein WC455_29200 [Dehalococcoidia bacterium]|jgi:hypothetical protein
MLAVYLKTKNDINGNPRRGWVIFGDNGSKIDFVEEGYQGMAALRRLYPNVAVTERIEVTPMEFRIQRTSI